MRIMTTCQADNEHARKTTVTIHIPLTQGKVAIIDDADLDLVSGYRWQARKDDRRWYAQTVVRRADGSRTTLNMHRLILGLTDPAIKTDHRDGNGLNNRRRNIRACTNAENMRNRGAYAKNKSGFKGVHWNKQRGKWTAQIKCIGKIKHLGLFATPEEAYSAYCAAAKELHGEFANFG